MNLRWNRMLLSATFVATVATAQTSVTTTGGTANIFPLFTGSTTVVNSVMTQGNFIGGTGIGIGLGTTAPAAILDVNGTSRISAVPVIVASGTSLTLGPSPTGMSVLNITNQAGNAAEAINFTNYGSYTAPGGAVTAGTMYTIGAGGPNVSGGGGTKAHENTLFIGNSSTSTIPFLLGPTGNLGLGGNITLSNLTGAGMVILASNNHVGIGTTAPAAMLEVNGATQIDGSISLTGTGAGIVFPNGGGTQTTAWTGVLCGGDYAESVDVSGDRTGYSPGDVLVIDSDTPGKFLRSVEPYSTSVVGVYSTKPGMVGRRQSVPKSMDEVPMAMIGIVPTKVSAENGPIKPGDLLVTASAAGYAMKGTDRTRMLGAVIGKALGSVESGTSVIEVVVTLQ